MRNIELNFFNKLHKKTRRDYLERMTPEKPYIVKKSKKYGRLYWDGDRKYGYGDIIMMEDGNQLQKLLISLD